MQKPKKKTLAWILGVVGAGLVGYMQGIVVEKVMVDQILEGIKNGDLTKVFAYILIFWVIWLEVRGLKKEVGKLNETIAKSFAKGEKRFGAIEHRIELIETIQRGDHGNIEKANFAGV